MEPTQFVGAAILITSSAAALVSIITALKQIPAVKKELKTMNEMSLGQLGEAQETRRIDKIPFEDRTAQEARHVAMTQRPIEASSQTFIREEPRHLDKRETRAVHEKLENALEEEEENQ
jgi:hypothetical protein